MQEVIFFFDDSGVFHRNAPSNFFVYAGYVFTNRDSVNDAKRKYINANKKLRISLGRSDELKASTLSTKHKRALFNAVREFDSVSATVILDKIYDYILNNKKSICRYKDYVLKRCVKTRLEEMITQERIRSDEQILISIYIDEQLTATNGYYDLRDSIKEELQYGIHNFDYGTHRKALFSDTVEVNIEYCNSSKNYMIQASDILANRIWTSYVKGDVKLRKINNHTPLTFP